MDDDLFISPALRIPSAELTMRTSKSSGPGGQHANKTSSRVSIEWDIENSGALSSIQRARLLRNLSTRLVGETTLVVHVDDSRSQHQNREIALKRLAEIVLKALRVQKKRVATKPSRAAKARRIDAKKKVGAKKKMRNKPSFDE